MKINLDTVADDAQIQIIPMIDVIFCILTFFILAALQMTRQQGMNIDLPQAKTGAVQMRQMLVVSIDQSGQTFIDQNVVDRAQLYTLLKQYHEKNPDGLLVLNASQNAFYNDVIQVLDVLRDVGGNKVALATIPSPTISPNPGMPNGQFGVPGVTPNMFPSGGLPGLPAVPGQTNPQLPSTNNPFSPPGPTQPSNILPPSSSGKMGSPGTSTPSTSTPSTSTPSTGTPSTGTPSTGSATPPNGTNSGADGLIPSDLGEPALPEGETTNPPPGQ
jgi:biopolymer transport protein ExbD